LCLAWGLLLTQDIGDVIGAEGMGCGSFLNRIGYGFGSVLADEFQQFRELPGEGAIGIGHVAQISLQHSLGTDAIENREEALLRSRTFGGWAQFGHFGFEAIGAEGLTAAPATWVRNDFLGSVINRDGTGISFEGEAATYKTRGHAIAVPVEVQTEILVNERLDCVAIVIRDDGQGT
jgi:hypothetical protein